eukprot:TRINITY_DN9577_c0_g1_i2.p1 TRINITY_DN9577_c0_g1~~TRINITY_DN9577_c0_g1_i2.p1  ORF type:complete len:113 (+),score=10.89 TRINITY_DN9577_c0_g1_i2:71-409(+)
MDNLATDTICFILSFLDPYDVARFGRTSKRNLKISRSDQLWREFYNQSWSHQPLIEVPNFSFYDHFVLNTIDIPKQDQSGVSKVLKLIRNLISSTRTTENFIENPQWIDTII